MHPLSPATSLLLCLPPCLSPSGSPLWLPLSPFPSITFSLSLLSFLLLCCLIVIMFLINFYWHFHLIVSISQFKMSVWRNSLCFCGLHSHANRSHAENQFTMEWCKCCVTSFTRTVLIKTMYTRRTPAQPITAWCYTFAKWPCTAIDYGKATTLRPTVSNWTDGVDCSWWLRGAPDDYVFYSLWFVWCLHGSLCDEWLVNGRFPDVINWSDLNIIGCRLCREWCPWTDDASFYSPPVTSYEALPGASSCLQPPDRSAP